jgi:hypothetical protein
VVRGERDRPQRAAEVTLLLSTGGFDEVRGGQNPSNSLLSRALIRRRKAGLTQHDEN